MVTGKPLLAGKRIYGKKELRKEDIDI